MTENYCDKQDLGYKSCYQNETEMFDAAKVKAKELGCPSMDPSKLYVNTKGMVKIKCDKVNEK